MLGMTFAQGNVAGEGGSQFPVERHVAGLENARAGSDGVEVELAVLELDPAIMHGEQIAALFAVGIRRVLEDDAIARFQRSMQFAQLNAIFHDAGNTSDKRTALFRIS